MRTIILAALAALLLATTANAAQMSSYTTKSTPVGADSVLINDSEAANATKKATLSSIVALSPSMTYPGAGVPLSTGSAWGTSYTVGTGASNLVQLNASAQLPAVSAALLTSFPTLNQNTTGTAAGLTAQYIDWSASSGGNSIANKPTIPTASDTVYDATSWNGNTDVPTKNAVRDKIESLPRLAAGTGITITEDGGGAGIDTIGVTSSTYQAYDVQLDTWAGVTPGTGVTTAIAANTGTTGGLPTIIASGATAMSGSLVSANTCSSAVAVAASGVATTDVIIANPNAILSSVAGYGATTAGALRIDVYPTAEHVNFQICNPTGADIDPDSITINWKVIR